MTTNRYQKNKTTKRCKMTCCLIICPCMPYVMLVCFYPRTLYWNSHFTGLVVLCIVMYDWCQGLYLFCIFLYYYYYDKKLCINLNQFCQCDLILHSTHLSKHAQCRLKPKHIYFNPWDRDLQNEEFLKIMVHHHFSQIHETCSWKPKFSRNQFKRDKTAVKKILHRPVFVCNLC